MPDPAPIPATAAGRPGTDYFDALSAALDRAGIAEPVLVLDVQRLDANIRAVATTLPPGGGQPAVRLVAKSLPCAPLLGRVAAALGTRRHMVFNRPMLADVLALDPGADILMGKPLMVAAAHAHYRTHPPRAGAPAAGPQWLIDTPERAAQYAQLAAALDSPLRVNFEIDVGLRRGGFASPAALARVLATLPPTLIPCGVMGYDPHIAKLPPPVRPRALAASQGLFAAFAQVLNAHRRSRGETAAATLNTGGSPTYALHRAPTTPSPDAGRANEVAIGSAFVKPADFDGPTLAHHVPACFIAAPVLKAQDPARMPGLPSWLEALVPGRGQAVFLHGGNWPAVPVHPAGWRTGALYGRSSNQERWSGRRGDAWRPQPGDWFFLRPRQSEAIFLQFGPLAVYEGGEIAARWPVFPVST